MKIYSYVVMIFFLVCLQIVVYILTLGPLGYRGRQEAVCDWFEVVKNHTER